MPRRTTAPVQPQPIQLGAIILSGAMLCAAWIAAPEPGQPPLALAPAAPTVAERDLSASRPVEQPVAASLSPAAQLMQVPMLASPLPEPPEPEADRAAARAARAAQLMERAKAPVGWRGALKALMALAWERELEAFHRQYHEADLAGAPAVERRDSERLYATLLSWGVARQLVHRYGVVADAQTAARFEAAGCGELLSFVAADPEQLTNRAAGSKGARTRVRTSRRGGSRPEGTVRLDVLKPGTTRFVSLVELTWVQADGRWRILSTAARHRIRPLGDRYTAYVRELESAATVEAIGAQLARARRWREALDASDSLAAFLTSQAQGD